MQAWVSLVVCTINRTDTLRRLLDSLRKQWFRRFEVILVDQNRRGALDSISTEFADLPILHIRSARGLSRARNAGLARCKGAIVGFPDDDCWYDSRVLVSVLDFFFSHPKMDFLTGRTVDGRGCDSLSRYLQVSAPITRSNVFVTGNSNTIFVRRRAALAVGGFDEALGVGASTPYQSCEESDFLLRCMAAGYQGYYDHEFSIRHDPITDSPERARAYSVGFGRVARLHQLGTTYFAARSVRTGLGGCYQLARCDLEAAHRRFAWLVGSIRGYAAPLEPADAQRIPRTIER
jgi:glycosyltransferase involved in cell wall biosynthesis